MRDSQSLAERYLALWNTADPARRLALLAQGWAEDAVHADPQDTRVGHAEIGALIAAVRERFPGCRWVLDGPARGDGAHMSLAWMLRAPGGEPVLRGVDFALVDCSRFKAVTSFLVAARQTA